MWEDRKVGLKPEVRIPAARAKNFSFGGKEMCLNGLFGALIASKEASSCDRSFGRFFCLRPFSKSGGKMKNFYKKLVAVVLLVMALMTLAACSNNGDVLTGEATLVVSGESVSTYTVDLSEAGFTSADTVYDLIVYLAEEEGLTFTAYASSSADYGYDAYITAIGSLAPTGSEYIAFYHNKEADADVSGGDWAEPIVYNETTLYYSGLGIGGVKLTSGIMVYFTLLTY